MGLSDAHDLTTWGDDVFMGGIEMRFMMVVVVLAVLTVLPAAVSADPPEEVAEGTPANGFATNCQQYLGPLRSAIARGELPGVHDGFDGSFNPGGHFGTVAEEAFLDSLGVDTSCN